MVVSGGGGGRDGGGGYSAAYPQENRRVSELPLSVTNDKLFAGYITVVNP